MLTGMRFPCLC